MNNLFDIIGPMATAAPTEVERYISAITGDIELNAQHRPFELSYMVLGRTTADEVVEALRARGFNARAKWMWEVSVACPPLLVFQMVLPKLRSWYVISVNW
jgi:hypothetical protein